MSYVNQVIEELKIKDASQPEFIQAVSEVLHSIELIFKVHPEYEKSAVLQRLIEPERIIQFKVPWSDDHGQVHVNRGYRVQFSNVLGPYKGGLRFHPSVNLGVMKFLAFEQIFKNALTTLPIGGAKGGSDFDPKGKSDNEIMRFCQSFMSELYRHIGMDTDVPAGDMGVGAREIGYLYGHYRRLLAVSERGVMTGKGLSYGGSKGRTQATGYGLLYFVKEILDYNKINYKGYPTLISGSGNVAIYACEKAQQMGFKVIAMSDSKGYIVDENLDLACIKELKEVKRASLKEYVQACGHGTYYEGSVYDANLKCKIVLPCATQNEIDLKRATSLLANGCILVGEGANMPSSNEAIAFYQSNQILFAPGKAANAGGVATSALEMSQNSMRLAWSFEEVDEKLKNIMQSIFTQCIDVIKKYDLKPNDYVSSANIAGAEKVITAMIAMGEY